MNIDYKYKHDPMNPILIYKRQKIDSNIEKVTGVVNIKGEKLNIGDTLVDVPGTLTDNLWVKEITKRFTPDGSFKIDMTDCGFEAIVVVENAKK